LSMTRGIAREDLMKALEMLDGALKEVKSSARKAIDSAKDLAWIIEEYSEAEIPNEDYREWLKEESSRVLKYLDEMSLALQKLKLLIEETIPMKLLR